MKRPADMMWDVAGRVLTVKQLEAFQMRYRDDLPVSVIADVLGVSRQAVQARIQAGRTRVLAELQKEAA